MTSHHSAAESEALDQVAEKLSQEGYALIRDPSLQDLPSGLGDYQPDAIAIGRSPKLLIEIISRRDPEKARSAKINRLQQLLVDKPEWKLHVVYFNAGAALPTPASANQIRRRLDEIRNLKLLDPAAGLVIGWSMLEASARLAQPRQAAQALTPATAVELLATLGYITQPEADALREAGKQRNRLVHGDLSFTIASATIDVVLKAVETVLSEALNVDDNANPT